MKFHEDPWRILGLSESAGLRARLPPGCAIGRKPQTNAPLE